MTFYAGRASTAALARHVVRGEFARKPRLDHRLGDVDTSQLLFGMEIFEEILRLETPVVGFFRVATRDTTIGGSVIPEGAKVLLHWAAANRDPAKYPDPDTFDISRNPLDHMAFSYGPHA